MTTKIRRIELCDLRDKHEGEICLNIVGKSLKNSEYTLTGGGGSAQFLDLDEYLLDPQGASDLVTLLSNHIEALNKNYFPFDKIALIDKGGKGPVGLIRLFDLLAQKMTKFNFIIVRPMKHLNRSVVKGSLKKKERVLLLNDVATVGWTIFEAAEKIRAVGAEVPYALVVMDRYQGAITNLARKGIQLISLFSLKQLLDEDKFQELEDKFDKHVDRAFELQLVDFGGTSQTISG